METYTRIRVLRKHHSQARCALILYESKRCDCCRLHLKFFGRSGPSKEDVNRALYRMSVCRRALSPRSLRKNCRKKKSVNPKIAIQELWSQRHRMTASTSTRKAAVAFTVIVMAACAVALTVNAGERTRGGCGRWGVLRSSHSSNSSCSGPESLSAKQSEDSITHVVPKVRIKLPAPFHASQLLNNHLHCPCAVLCLTQKLTHFHCPCAMLCSTRSGQGDET